MQGQKSVFTHTNSHNRAQTELFICMKGAILPRIKSLSTPFITDRKWIRFLFDGFMVQNLISLRPTRLYQCPLSNAYPKGAVMSAFTCPKCWKSTNGNEKFCCGCGHRLDNICPEWGKVVRYMFDHRYCPDCGHNMKSPPAKLTQKGMSEIEVTGWGNSNHLKLHNDHNWTSGTHFREQL